jgi:hypothetical protein
MRDYQSIDELATAFVNMIAGPHVEHLKRDISQMTSGELTMPSVAALQSVLIPTFLASIRHEEGRPVRFRWVMPVQGSREEDVPMVRFEEPREFTADELVRLSPVVNSGMRQLVVRFSENKPQIVGIQDSALHRDSYQLLSQLNSYPLDQLECSVIGAGHLRLAWGYMSIDYDSERVHQKLSLMSSDLEELFSRIAATGVKFKGTGLLPEDAAPAIRERAEEAFGTRHFALIRFWDRVLDRVQKSGHGGTFLILAEPVAVAMTPKYRLAVQGVSNIIKEHSEWAMGFAQVRFRDDLDDDEKRAFEAFLCEYLVLDRKLAHLVDLVASVASVDGAVLMNREFDVLGFGMRVAVTSENADMEIETIDWTDGEFRRRKRRMSTLGMRHLSAAEFVAKNDGSIAIVVSQDGNLRIFGRNYTTKQLECSECFAPFGTILQNPPSPIDDQPSGTS